MEWNKLVRNNHVMLTSAYTVLSYPQSTLRKLNKMRQMQKRWIISSLVTTNLDIATIKATSGLLDCHQRVQSLPSAGEEKARIRLSSELE